MRYTFKPDDCMVITIPLTSVRNAAEGQLMPDKFSCRFKDTYKVYQRGWPKALGAAQIATAVFILCLGVIKISYYYYHLPFTYIVMILSILFFVSGSLAIAAAQTPLMPLMKVSFVFNIISLCLAISLVIYTCVEISEEYYGFYGPLQTFKMWMGLNWMFLVLFLFEFLLSVILIHWESKALCRTHFNSLPMITLKQDM
ncbi:uncharacterized protein LOC125138337 isoform X1 [Tachysurus fulvidraco]|uniref:uncharacterized protein LOC125138337 isoform X1 n=1 Tax=Tachysurus fulvidraco TaxID=1234273 RepID=UPI001FEFED4B|nr:uncharacterized protein LOC125138337 isoform X1 [Tachysurus fulvidraco]